MRQAEQLGLGHAVLCAERAVGGDPFAVLLADDFLTDCEPGVTADLAGGLQAVANRNFRWWRSMGLIFLKP